MMMTLLVVGLALIVFGGVVLMKYSDRPGGAIKALGAEVSSTGAGLPLIALGVACIGYAATHWPDRDLVVDPPRVDTPGAKPVPPSDTGCVARVLAPAVGRVDTVETGMQGVEVIGAHEGLDAPFAIVLTDNKQPVGVIRARLYQSSNSSANLYKIEQAVDARCAPATGMANLSVGGNPQEIMNWNTLRLTLGASTYNIRIGGEGMITVSVTRAN